MSLVLFSWIVIGALGASGISSSEGSRFRLSERRKVLVSGAGGGAGASVISTSEALRFRLCGQRQKSEVFFLVALAAVVWDWAAVLVLGASGMSMSVY